MAGHGGTDRLQPLAQRQGRAVLGQVVGDVAHEARSVGVTQQRRRLAHQHRARPERFDHQAEGG